MADLKTKSKVKLQGGANLPAQPADKALILNVSGDIVSSPVSSSELGHLAGVTSSVQDQIDLAQSDAASAQAAADAAQSSADTAQSTIDGHISDASDAHDASAISSIPSGNLVATDVQSALNELQSSIDSISGSTALADHINETTGAHASSAISSIPSGNLSASDVQSALNELQSDIDTRATSSDLSDHINETVGAHAASAISVSPSGNLAATDAQSALVELQLDVDSRALDSDVIKKDGSVDFTSDQSMGGNRIVSMADPIAAQDSATKAYVDSVAQGLNIKSSVIAASVAALPAVTSAGSGVGKTLTADANGALSIDDVSSFVDVATDGGSTNPTDTVGTRASRVLIKDQVDPVDNGIYVVQDKGSAGTQFILVRAIDADGTPASEVESIFCFVREGTVNAIAGFVQITSSPVVDTDSLVFTQFSGAGQVIAGDALEKVGNTLNVKVDGQGIEVVADELSIELDGSTLSKSASGLKLSDTAVTPASLGSASESLSITVDQQGRLTSASAQSIDITASQVSDFDEAAQDSIGGILSNTQTVLLTYDDVTPFIYADIISQMSITDDTAGLKLVGDSLTPGNTKYYGTDGSGNKGFYSIPDTGASSGDIAEMSFVIANGQASAADVTGLAFAAGTVRGFKALVTVEIDGTVDLYETFELLGINKGGSFDMSQEGVGDETGVVFTITSAGQVQYTSATYAGFVSGTVKFRATVTSV